MRFNLQPQLLLGHSNLQQQVLHLHCQMEQAQELTGTHWGLRLAGMVSDNVLSSKYLQIDLSQTVPQGQHQLLKAPSTLQDETLHRLALYSSSPIPVSFLFSKTHADGFQYVWCYFMQDAQKNMLRILALNTQG